MCVFSKLVHQPPVDPFQNARFIVVPEKDKGRRAWGGFAPQANRRTQTLSPRPSRVTGLVLGRPGIFTPGYQLTHKPFPDTLKSEPHRVQLKTCCVCVRWLGSECSRGHCQEREDGVSLYKPQSHLPLRTNALAHDLSMIGKEAAKQPNVPWLAVLDKVPAAHGVSCCPLTSELCSTFHTSFCHFSSFVPTSLPGLLI